MKFSGISAIFVCTVLSILLADCKSDNKDQVVFKKATLNSLTDILDSIRIVRLDLQDTILIGPYPLIMQKDSSFYIADRYRQYRIFRFSLSGQFMNTIGQSGNGPGEYSGNITDVFIEDKDDDVYMLTSPASIYRYSKNGKFKDRVRNDEFAALSFIKQDSIYWINSLEAETGRPNLFKADARLKIIDTLYTTKSNLFNHNINPNSSHTFRKIADRIFFWNIPYPIVYELTTGDIQENISFHFKPSDYASSKDLELLDLRKLIRVRMPQMITGHYRNSKYNITEFGCFMGHKDNREIHVIYAIQNRKTEKWDWIDYKLPEDAEKFWQHQFFDMSEEGILYCYFPGWKVLESYNKVKSIITNPEILESINEDRDLFIFLCYLK